MSDFKERLIQEQKDLQEKIEKLDSFLESNEFFEKLNKGEQDLLTIQLYAMRTYNTVLLTRIDRLKD